MSSESPSNRSDDRTTPNANPFSGYTPSDRLFGERDAQSNPSINDDSEISSMASLLNPNNLDDVSSAMVSKDDNPSDSSSPPGDNIPSDIRSQLHSLSDFKVTFALNDVASLLKYVIDEVHLLKAHGAREYVHTRRRVKDVEDLCQDALVRSDRLQSSAAASGARAEESASAVAAMRAQMEDQARVIVGLQAQLAAVARGQAGHASLLEAVALEAGFERVDDEADDAGAVTGTDAAAGGVRGVGGIDDIDGDTATATAPGTTTVATPAPVGVLRMRMRAGHRGAAATATSTSDAPGAPAAPRSTIDHGLGLGHSAQSSADAAGEAPAQPPLPLSPPIAHSQPPSPAHTHAHQHADAAVDAPGAVSRPRTRAGPQRPASSPRPSDPRPASGASSMGPAHDSPRPASREAGHPALEGAYAATEAPTEALEVDTSASASAALDAGRRASPPPASLSLSLDSHRVVSALSQRLADLEQQQEAARAQLQHQARLLTDTVPLSRFTDQAEQVRALAVRSTMAEQLFRQLEARVDGEQAIDGPVDNNALRRSVLSLNARLRQAQDKLDTVSELALATRKQVAQMGAFEDSSLAKSLSLRVYDGEAAVKEVEDKLRMLAHFCGQMGKTVARLRLAQKQPPPADTVDATQPAPAPALPHHPSVSHAHYHTHVLPPAPAPAQPPVTPVAASGAAAVQLAPRAASVGSGEALELAELDLLQRPGAVEAILGHKRAAEDPKRVQQSMVELVRDVEALSDLHGKLQDARSLLARLDDLVQLDEKVQRLVDLDVPERLAFMERRMNTEVSFLKAHLAGKVDQSNLKVVLSLLKAQGVNIHAPAAAVANAHAYAVTPAPVPGPGARRGKVTEPLSQARAPQLDLAPVLAQLGSKADCAAVDKLEEYVRALDRQHRDAAVRTQAEVAHLRGVLEQTRPGAPQPRLHTRGQLATPRAPSRRLSASATHDSAAEDPDWAASGPGLVHSLLEGPSELTVEALSQRVAALGAAVQGQGHTLARKCEVDWVESVREGLIGYIEEALARVPANTGAQASNSAPAASMSVLVANLTRVHSHVGELSRRSQQHRAWIAHTAQDVQALREWVRFAHDALRQHSEAVAAARGIADAPRRTAAVSRTGTMRASGPLSGLARGRTARVTPREPPAVLPGLDAGAVGPDDEEAPALLTSRKLDPHRCLSCTRPLRRLQTSASSASVGQAMTRYVCSVCPAGGVNGTHTVRGIVEENRRDARE